MISELRKIKCKHCNKCGLTQRTKVETVPGVTKDNEMAEFTIWSIKCRYCKKSNKIIWETL